MQIDIEHLTPEAHEALVECLKIAARRGRMLREAREREQETTCIPLLKNNLVDEAERRIPLEDQSQPTNNGQHDRCASSSGETVIDLAITDV